MPPADIIVETLNTNNNMSTLEKIFAEKLLAVKAIKLQPEQPFTWASGWKSPFYCDNRKTLAFPALRSFVKLELSRIVAEKYPEADAIVLWLPTLSVCHSLTYVQNPKTTA